MSLPPSLTPPRTSIALHLHRVQERRHQVHEGRQLRSGCSFCKTCPRPDINTVTRLLEGSLLPLESLQLDGSRGPKEPQRRPTMMTDTRCPHPCTQPTPMGQLHIRSIRHFYALCQAMTDSLNPKLVRVNSGSHGAMNSHDSLTRPVNRGRHTCWDALDWHEWHSLRLELYEWRPLHIRNCTCTTPLHELRCRTGSCGFRSSAKHRGVS